MALRAMRPSSITEHVCPNCRSGNLSLPHTTRPAADQIESGVIVCEDCAASYPITNGLPRFVPESNYADSFGFQWNRHARTQLDSHSGLGISRDRVLGALGPGVSLRGRRILEAGSGAGRFTEVLVRCGADVVSFDYSSAVDANASNQQSPPNLHLFQGDIFNIPLVEGSFDTVLCLGVIQHTPDPAAAFVSLARYVRPGGQLVIDSYPHSVVALLHWKYILRPITKRMRKETLYRIIERFTPPLIPVAKWLRRLAGRLGARLVPIVEYSHLGLPLALNRQWAILDTFDMYSPAHDHPASRATIYRWFAQAGFDDIQVRRGPNGIVASARRPSTTTADAADLMVFNRHSNPRTT
jgi:2-polyprenyl-3-methyl-5-hydroxy-6-metoxy-1,4-benzoquinol methylase